MDREQLAWAAGFFDGEGTFSAVEQKGGRRSKPGSVSVSPRVSIGQVDREVLDRFVLVLGVGHVKPNPYVPENPNHQPRWDYVTSGYEDLQFVLAALWPWLGSLKRAQGRKALLRYREWKATAPGRGSNWRNKTHCPSDHPYIGENIIWVGPDRKWRRCRVCDLNSKGCHRASTCLLQKIDELHAAVVSNGKH